MHALIKAKGDPRRRISITACDFFCFVFGQAVHDKIWTIISVKWRTKRTVTDQQLL